MQNSPATLDLLWEHQLRVEKARRDIGFRKWLKSFALMFAWIALALTVAAVLAGLAAAGSIQL
ncbi:MAG: hypothetical protein ACKV22_36165 [Bryobacteraceae bacterium]